MRHTSSITSTLRKAFAVGLSLSLAFGTVPVTAFAASSDQIRAEMAEVQARLVVLNDEAEQCAYELQATTAALNETNAEIDRLNIAIVETAKELEQARIDLSLTMSWAYKVHPDIMSLILSSASFEELISNVYYANKVSSTQTAQAVRVRELREQQDQQMADLETRQAEQIQLVEEQKVRNEAAQQAVAELAAYQGSLSVELQEALAEEERARQEEARRQAEEERRRQEEEEERRRQQEEEEEQEDPSAPDPADPEPSDPDPADPEPSDPDPEPSDPEPSDPEPSDPDPVDPEPSYPEIYVPPAGDVAAMVERAYSVIGSNYTWSGYVWTGSIYTSYFTCSGLVDFALGRSTNSSWPESLYAEVGSRLVTDTSQLQYGDLVFFSYAGRYPGHVGIYIGGGSMIDSCPGGGVAIRSLDWMDFIGGGPIF